MKTFRVYADTSVRRYFDIKATSAEEANKKMREYDGFDEWGYDEETQEWEQQDDETAEVEPEQKATEDCRYVCDEHASKHHTAVCVSPNMVCEYGDCDKEATKAFGD